MPSIEYYIGRSDSSPRVKPGLHAGPAVHDPETGTGIRDRDRTGNDGPRIRCPRCGWTPAAGDLWSCTCGHSWNTFDTGGVCPQCLHQWTSTQCLACSRWSLHSDWYEY